MSKSHIVVRGDTLGAIASKYYGSWSEWPKIISSNPQLAGRKTAVDGSPLIYPGDVLIILPEEKPVQIAETLPVNSVPIVLDADAPNDITIMVGGKTFTGFTGYSISQSIDKFDAFSFSAPFDDSMKEHRKAFMPFTYQDCTVYYDGKLLFNGTLLTPDPEATADSKTVTIQGYPKCGVSNDCCLPESKYPPEYNGLTISDIAQDVLSPFGVGVVVKGDVGGPFEKVEYNPGDSVFSFLSKLAGERGLMISNEKNGDFLFWIPEKETVCDSIKEGELPFISCKAQFDSQQFYSHVTGFAKVEKEEDASSFTYENKYLISKGIIRPYSFTVDDATSGDLESCVKAKVGRMFASSVKYTLTVLGHKNSKGELWRKNMAISVLSPGAMIFKETVLLVDSVEISRSDSDGNKTVLSLVLPGARDGSLCEEFPWEE